MYFLPRDIKKPNWEPIVINPESKISRYLFKTYFKSLVDRVKTFDPDHIAITIKLNNGNDLDGTLKYPEWNINAGTTINECLDYLINNYVNNNEVNYLYIYHLNKGMPYKDMLDHRNWTVVLYKEGDDHKWIESCGDLKDYLSIKG